MLQVYSPAGKHDQGDYHDRMGPWWPSGLILWKQVRNSQCAGCWLLNGHDDKACLIIRTETVLEMLTLFHWLCEDPGPGPLGLAFLPF